MLDRFDRDRSDVQSCVEMVSGRGLHPSRFGAPCGLTTGKRPRRIVRAGLNVSLLDFPQAMASLRPDRGSSGAGGNLLARHWRSITGPFLAELRASSCWDRRMPLAGVDAAGAPFLTSSANAPEQAVLALPLDGSCWLRPVFMVGRRLPLESPDERSTFPGRWWSATSRRWPGLTRVANHAEDPCWGLEVLRGAVRGAPLRSSDSGSTPSSQDWGKRNGSVSLAGSSRPV